MFGKRCEECGETRWSLLGRDEGETPCPNCGTPMVEERRRPGARRRLATEAEPVERRDAPTTPVSG
jgi:uncharacterized Zn finger protein (UPF0148 family)